ncbi:MAG TPA: cytochrome c peroxidase [Kofleriaceae bacterium]|nr:cytochrome c peroxidase [Kofleriaceae bacterium]
MQGYRRIAALSLLAACGSSELPAPGRVQASGDRVAQGPRPAPAPAAGELSPEERAQLATLSPLPAVPPDPTNAYADDPKAARLGQMLFFDPAFSGPLVVGDEEAGAEAAGGPPRLGKAGEAGKVSCRTCHDGPGLDDRRAQSHVSRGTAFGTRNALPVVNSAFYQWTNWGGRFDSQWSLAVAVVEKADLMNGTRLGVAHRLFARYRAEYDAVFPVRLDPALDPKAPGAARFPPSGKPKRSPDAPDGPWEKMAAADREIVNVILANYGKAVAAYMRLLVSRDAPFDRFVAGDAGAISPAARRGVRTFLRHCASCHAGPHLSDEAFHVVAIAQHGARVPETDHGRATDVPGLLASPWNSAGAYSDARGAGKLGGLAPSDAMRGQFRTKGLRGVALTAPYMHAGQLATLEDVVRFYNAGGGSVVDTGYAKDRRMVRLGLSPAEQADLVELMKTFTGAPVPAALLVDTSRTP